VDGPGEMPTFMAKCIALAHKKGQVSLHSGRNAKGTEIVYVKKAPRISGLFDYVQKVNR